MGKNGLVGMVGVHANPVHRGQLWPDEIPGFAIVGASSQDFGRGVDYSGLQRIESEELNSAAQIEHAPGVASIMADIGPGHVTCDQHLIGIVRVDGGVEHGAAPTGADFREFARAGRLAHHAECNSANRPESRVLPHTDFDGAQRYVLNRFYCFPRPWSTSFQG